MVTRARIGALAVCVALAAVAAMPFALLRWGV